MRESGGLDSPSECGMKNKAKLGLAVCILFRDLPEMPNMEDRAAIYTPGPGPEDMWSDPACRCGDSFTSISDGQQPGKGAEVRTLTSRE